MKSFLSVFSFVLLLVLLAGCSAEEAPEEAPVVNEPSLNKDSTLEEVEETEAIIGNGEVEEAPFEEETIEPETELVPAIDPVPEASQIDPQIALEAAADEVIIALNDRDMAAIDAYVHASKGLIFSPYINVKPDAVHIPKQEIPTLLARTDVLVWGEYDGIGTPIALTPADYFDEFLDLSLFLQPDEKLVNANPEQRGNMINNLIELFPESLFVEYYHEGTVEYAGMDWESVVLVFLQDESADYYLIAIVQDKWTI